MSESVNDGNHGAQTSLLRFREAGRHKSDTLHCHKNGRCANALQDILVISSGHCISCHLVSQASAMTALIIFQLGCTTVNSMKGR